MSLKNQKIVVFGSLILQILICNFVNPILLMELPEWFNSVILLFIPYLIWSIQLFIGRATGLTNGLSSSMIILVYLWSTIISLNGYEWALLPPFFIVQLPILLLFIAICVAGYEIYISFKNKDKLVNINNEFLSQDRISLLVASLLPIFMLYSGKAPLMTLGYVDRGIKPEYFSGGFLLFLTIPTILLLILSIINLKINFKKESTKQRKIASIILVIGLILFSISSFFMPFLFWFGINPIIFMMIMISAPLITPKRYLITLNK